MAEAPKQPFPDAELVPLLQRLAHQEPEHAFYSPWAKLGLPDARQVILGSPLLPDGGDSQAKGAPPPELAAALGRVAKAYNLSPEVARAFLAARLYLEPEGGWFEPLSEDQAKRALEAHRLALQLAPGNLAVLGSLAGAAGKLYHAPGYQAAIAEGLDHAPQPIEVALRLSRAKLAYWSCEFSAYAVSRQPSSLQQALEAFGLGDSEEPATLFYLAAFHRLTSAPGAPFPEALAERLLRNLFQLGQSGLALDVLGRYPEGALKTLRAGAGKARDHRDASDGGIADAEVPQSDVRLDIASALLARGKVEEARAWYGPAAASLAAAPAHSKEPQAQGGRDRDELRPVLLARLLGAESAKDPFDLLLLGDEHSDLATHLLLAKALAGRFPKRARRDLAWLSRVFSDKPRHPRELLLRDRLTFLDGTEAELARGRAQEASLIQGELQKLQAPAEAVRPDPVAARIKAQLDRPPIRVFTEKAEADLPRPSQAQGAWKALTKAEAHLPRGFWLVRAERKGRKAVAVALSQRLDPTGEVSAGGYWVFLSEDGGEHWKASLYTGLRENRPYQLQPQSTLPMLEGTELRLATSVRELDESSISFPPVALKTRKEVTGRVLVAQLSALRRDTDGDGLTDLVEDRLLLDPNASDTDGDGAPDGRDLLPQVPQSHGPASTRSELISALLFELAGGRQPKALVTGIPQGKAQPALPKGEAPSTLEDLRYLELDRADLQGVKPLWPVVAFTEEELQRAQERFGTFFPLSIEVYLSESGDRALLEWDEHWRGGSFLARREGDHWVLEERETWVT